MKAIHPLEVTRALLIAVVTWTGLATAGCAAELKGPTDGGQPGSPLEPPQRTDATGPSDGSTRHTNPVGDAARQQMPDTSGSSWDGGRLQFPDTGVVEPPVDPPPGEPRIVWVIIADGAVPPPSSHSASCVSGGPPWTCGFGKDQAECKTKLMKRLYELYADFNIEFTFKQPSTKPYYKVYIAGGPNSLPTGSSPQQLTMSGVFYDTCDDKLPITPMSCMKCGSTLETCMIGFLHEHGHLMGLVHSTSTRDVMYPKLCCPAIADRFANTTFSSKNRCRPAQNSYQVVMQVLGPRK